MTSVEAIASVLGIAAVVLSVRRNVANFPLAIASVILFGWVVYQHRLYSDTLLQLLFVAANVYGWIKWTNAEAATRVIAVERMSARAIASWVVAWALTSIGWAWLTATFTDAARPWWDAPTFIASVAAQILMGQRKLENWLVWIAVDLALIPLYAVQHLYGFAALYVMYLGLSIWGWLDWRSAVRSEAGEAALA